MRYQLGIWTVRVALAGAVAAVGCGGESRGSGSRGVSDAGPDGAGNTIGAGATSGAGGTAATGGVGGAGATSGSGAAASGGAGGAGGSAPVDPCDAACTRVADCLVSDCPGIDAGARQQMLDGCLNDCEGEGADMVIGAPSCTEVVELIVPTDRRLEIACGPNHACAGACEHYARCTVSECTALDNGNAARLLDGCLDFCDAEIADAFNSLDCPTLAAVMSEPEGDAGVSGYGLTCSLGLECSGPTECAPYAEKLTGCLVAGCSGPIDEYATGIQELLALACQDPEDCPGVGGVAYVMDPSVGCSADELAGLGSTEPFDRLCEGTPPITSADLRAKCVEIVACDFPEGPGTVDLCMALVALASEPAVIPCLQAATSCGAIGACFN